MSDEPESVVPVFLRGVGQRVERMEQHMRDTGLRLTTLERQAGNLTGTEASHCVSVASRIDGVTAHLDRIEHRLDLAEHRG